VALPVGLSLNNAGGSPIIGRMHALRLFTVIAVATAVLAAPAAAKTPIPTKAAGSGNEPTAGGGVMPGKAFVARDAVALLDISFDQVEIYIFPKHVACSDVLYTQPPYVDVTVDTHGSPLLVGKPSLQNGVAYVQVDFHPATGSKYFAIQPGASITFTRVDPAKTGVWHGSLTVKRQRFDGHVFSYSGTFAARWCGKD
jgi:hypothetical protein